MLVDKILGDVCMICQTDFEFGMGLPDYSATRIASSEAIVKIFGRKINGEILIVASPMACFDLSTIFLINIYIV